MTERFDDLARAVANDETVGRRRLLRRALAAAGLGAGAALLGERPAIAGSTVQCPPGLTDCKGLCRDTSSHPNNCGACGIVCTNDSVCRAGACVKVTVGCPAGQNSCNGTCVNLSSDPANCGACGRGCSSGQTCVSGACSGPVSCPTCQVPSSDGLTCVPAAVNTDPKNECPSSPCHTGTCDGAGACGAMPTQTVCGAATCSNGVETSAGCDGRGICVSTSRNCAPYTCGPTACKTACSVNGDCLNAVCQNGVCI